MKYKRYFYGGFLVALLFLSHSSFAQNMVVGFAEIQGRGIAPDRLQINHIQVDITIPDPLIRDQPRVITLFYDIQFKVCQIGDRLQLMPILTFPEPFCEPGKVDLNNSEISGTAIDSVQITRRVDDQNITTAFLFDPITLHLVERITPEEVACAKLRVQVVNTFTSQPVPFALVGVGQSIQQANAEGVLEVAPLIPQPLVVSSNQEGFDLAQQSIELSCNQDNFMVLNLSPPKEVRISLDWANEQLDLDAHLTGPAPGAPGSYFNEPDRFHLYFGNKNVECVDNHCRAQLFIDEVLETKPENLLLSASPGAATLGVGAYRFTAHHFNGSGSLTESGAQVRLWIGNRPEMIFTPPPVEQAVGELAHDRMDIWRPFKLEVGEDGTVKVERPNKDYASGINPSEVR